MRSRLAFAMALPFLLGPAAACAPSSPGFQPAARPVAQAQPDTAAAGFREVSFLELTGRRFPHDLPVRFRVPAAFIPVRSPAPTQTWWLTREDSIGQAQDTTYSPRDGFFSVKLSLNVGYDAEYDTFFGGFAGEVDDETAMVENYRTAGFDSVVVERYNVNRVPVLLVEGRQGGRRAMIAYVATLIDTNVGFLHYAHADPFREVDGRRWQEMKRAILSSGEVVPVPLKAVERPDHPEPPTP